MSYEPPANSASYKDLLVWQKSMAFACAVISLTDLLDTDRKHYRLIEQLEAAAASVPMNIAEGKGRNSTKEFAQFLYIARGSLFETMTLIELFEMKHWIPVKSTEHLTLQANEIGKMINGLIRAIKA